MGFLRQRKDNVLQLDSRTSLMLWSRFHMLWPHPLESVRSWPNPILAILNGTQIWAWKSVSTLAFQPLRTQRRNTHRNFPCLPCCFSGFRKGPTNRAPLVRVQVMSGRRPPKLAIGFDHPGFQLHFHGTDASLWLQSSF